MITNSTRWADEIAERVYEDYKANGGELAFEDWVAEGMPEDDGAVVTNSALKQFGRSVDDLSGAASQPFKNTGLTKAARALDKHVAGQRSSGTFPPLSGNAAARNKQAQQIVDDILNNSKSEFKTLGRGGLEVRSPSGQGVRFNKDGSFSGFVD